MGYFSYGSVESGLFTQRSGDFISYQIVWFLLLHGSYCQKLCIRAKACFRCCLAVAFFLAFLVSAILSYVSFEPGSATLIKFLHVSDDDRIRRLARLRWDSVDHIFDSFFEDECHCSLFFFIFCYFPVIGSFIIYDTLERVSLCFRSQHTGGLFGHKSIAGEFFRI